MSQVSYQGHCVTCGHDHRKDRLLDAICTAEKNREEIEQAFSQAYFLITGRSPAFSANFGIVEALAEIKDACTVLRSAASAPTLSYPEFNTPTIPFEEAMKYAVKQPQAAEPKGLTLQDVRLLAMRYAVNYTEFDDGSLDTIDFGEYGFANFARALLAKGE